MKLTAPEVCERYRITPRTISRLVRLGVIRRAGYDAETGRVRFECAKLEGRSWGNKRGWRAERKVVR